MAVDTKDMVDQIRSGALPATRHLDNSLLVDLAHSLYRRSRIRGVLCVLNKIPDEETERFLRARLAETGIDPIGVIHHHRSVTTSWLRGRALDVTGAGEEARCVAEKLDATEAEYERPAAASPAPTAFDTRWPRR